MPGVRGVIVICIREINCENKYICEVIWVHTVIELSGRNQKVGWTKRYQDVWVADWRAGVSGVQENEGRGEN